MLKERIRKLAAITLLGSMVLLLIPAASMAQVIAEPVINQQENEISPRLTYIVEAECDLMIEGTEATVDCWVNGRVNDATKAKVIAELQVKSGEDNWIPVAIWTDTQDGFEASVYETKSVVQGHTYRVKATFTVWKGTQSETLTDYTREVTA